jgi:hypothetical protein
VSSLEQLQNWYLDNFDGDWEHGSGVSIKTLDNPGWLFEVNASDLHVTVEDRACNLIERSENDWIGVKIENGWFIGACGPRNLEELIHVFLKHVRFC